MPSRRRTSLKSSPLDLDRELDDMYSSPITRPSLGFLRVAPTSALGEEAPNGCAEELTESQTNGNSSLGVTPTSSIIGISRVTTPIDPASMVPVSMDRRSHVALSTLGLTPNNHIPAVSTDTSSMDSRYSKPTDFTGRDLGVPASTDNRSMDIRPPGKWKVHRCAMVQDGHSANEQLLYEMFWRSAKPANPDERLISISREDMAAQTRITIRNIKGVLDRLIQKLAVERLLEPNSFARAAATYRIYSYRSILDRRRKAGLEWVTRANGVRFISPQVAQAILAKSRFHEGDSSQPSGDMLTSPRDLLAGSGSTALASMDDRYIGPTPALSGEGTPPIPVDLGPGLRKINPAFDSAAVARLWRECRSRIPDCTVDEVLHFVGLKADKLWADKSVRNTIGLLLTSVPEFFDPSILNEYRDERQRQIEEEARAAEENQRYWRAVLEDSNATEEDRVMAMQFVVLD